MEKFSYNNVTIFYLKYQIYCILMQSHNTFLLYSNVSGALYRVTRLSKTIQRWPFLFTSLTAGTLFIYPYVYINMILAVVSIELDRIQS